jgi:hypothetical protein
MSEGKLLESTRRNPIFWQDSVNRAGNAVMYYTNINKPLDNKDGETVFAPWSLKP